MLLTFNCWPGFPQLCLYVGFHFACRAQLSLKKQSVLKSGSGYGLFYCSVGVCGMGGKTSELWFPVPVVISRIIWKRGSCIAKTPWWPSWWGTLGAGYIPCPEKKGKLEGATELTQVWDAARGPQQAGKGRRNPANREFPALSRSPGEEENACREAETNAKPLRSPKGGDIPWDPE